MSNGWHDSKWDNFVFSLILWLGIIIFILLGVSVLFGCVWGMVELCKAIAN